MAATDPNVEVHHPIKSKQAEAVAIAIWSAFEAAVCLSLIELGQETDDPIQISGTPLGLTAQAVAHGVIDPQDRELLLRLQDAIAYGKIGTIDSKILQQVSKFTERTLDEMRTLE